MLPTIQDGDLLTIEEIPAAQLQRGDLIVFKIDETRQYLKRLIGLPGETVEIRDGKVSINGKVLDEPYIKGPTEGDSLLTLRADRYFVLGDNRSNSADSRQFGSIQGESILGRVKR